LSKDIDALEDAQTGTTVQSPSECEPVTVIPAWWSGFLFHVLNPRQLCMFVYLTMLVDGDGVCHPTIEQIRKDLGLLSDTMVFDALTVLEELGFVVRTRRILPESRSKRNVYQRTACEFTILRLVEHGKIDGMLRPASAPSSPAAEESRQLVDEGLQMLLGEGYSQYVQIDESEKTPVLIALLKDILAKRPRGIFQ
jgi:hypothetical protein